MKFDLMVPLVPRRTKGSCKMVARAPLNLGLTQNQKAISDLGRTLSDLASALPDLCRTILNLELMHRERPL